MGITEITILILGIGAFVASFVIPEKKRLMDDTDRKFGEAQIEKLVDGHMQDVKGKITDAAEETVNYAVEKTERALDRLTNEKIMAVNEYSDTVLKEIHKNHEEVVFLYDMLNDKHTNLKNTAIEVEKTAKEAVETVEETVRSVAEEVSKAVEVSKAAAGGNIASLDSGEEKAKHLPDLQDDFVSLKPERTVEKAVNDEEGTASETKGNPKQKAVRKTASRVKKLPAKNAGKEGEMPEVNISFAPAGGSTRNNNEKILALHKQGKSNMAVAKELGLGIGEVKLVIDLFEGI